MFPHTETVLCPPSLPSSPQHNKTKKTTEATVYKFYILLPLTVPHPVAPRNPGLPFSEKLTSAPTWKAAEDPFHLQ